MPELTRFRKSRAEMEANKPTPESSTDSSEDATAARPRNASQGQLDRRDTLSPSQRSVDLEQGQHMPHLICSSAMARSSEIFFADRF